MPSKMKKTLGGVAIFVLTVLYGGRISLTHAENAGSPQNQETDFDADVAQGEQQVAQDPVAAQDQEEVVNGEDQTAGDALNGDVASFATLQEAETAIDAGDVDSQGNVNDSAEADLPASAADTPDADNLSSQSEDTLNQEMQDDQSEGSQSQGQDQLQQDQSQQDQSQQDQTTTDASSGGQ